MKNIAIIIKKQLKDTVKNKTVLIQFVLFPILTLIMENAIKLDGMPELFFTKLFSVMYIGMAPLSAAAAIISEEKEKNTLRVLMMADVSPLEFLFGVGIYVWGACMIGACVMATGFEAKDVPFYLAVMGAGYVVSITAGACIGTAAKSQMAATSLVMPVMVFFSFAPMLSMFNDHIKRVAGFFYTQQLSVLFERMSFDGADAKGIVILAANAAVMFMLFFVTFKRKGLE